MPPNTRSQNTSHQPAAINSEIMKILGDIEVDSNKKDHVYIYKDNSNSNVNRNVQWNIDLGLLDILNPNMIDHARAAILVVFASNIYDAKQNNKTPQNVLENMNYIIVNFVMGLKKCHKANQTFKYDDKNPPVSLTPNWPTL
jgi:hypothetical protein